MNAAREEILGRLRAASRWVPAMEEPPVPPPPAAEAAAALASRFVEEARRSDAEAFLEADKAAAIGRLRTLCQGEAVLAWDLPFLPAGLWSSAAAPLAATLGVTGCELAIADTGTIALAAGPGRPRLASLSVRIHVALVDPRQIIPDLPSALGAIQARGAANAHVNLVTGPSRTADIEMTLTRGVHGPKRLIVIVAPWLGA